LSDLCDFEAHQGAEQLILDPVGAVGAGRRGLHVLLFLPEGLAFPQFSIWPLTLGGGLAVVSGVFRLSRWRGLFQAFDEVGAVGSVDRAELAWTPALSEQTAWHYEVNDFGAIAAAPGHRTARRYIALT
jgi:hypothetical protein